MLVSLTFDLQSCEECPFRYYVHEHGGSFDMCRHPQSPPGFGSVIGKYDGKFPQWCPFAKGEEK